MRTRVLQSRTSGQWADNGEGQRANQDHTQSRRQLFISERSSEEFIKCWDTLFEGSASYGLGDPLKSPPSCE